MARTLTEYPEIKEIDVVEPDEMFIEVSSKFFPETAKGFEDPRVKIHNMDGLRYLRRCEGQYDLIINDSTDPFGHTEGLFTKEFYGSCYKALKEDGYPGVFTLEADRFMDGYGSDPAEGVRKLAESARRFEKMVRDA